MFERAESWGGIDTLVHWLSVHDYLYTCCLPMFRACLLRGVYWRIGWIVPVTLDLLACHDVFCVSSSANDGASWDAEVVRCIWNNISWKHPVVHCIVYYVERLKVWRLTTLLHVKNHLQMKSLQRWTRNTYARLGVRTALLIFICSLYNNLKLWL